jgi:hypothetical protein
MMYPIVLVCGVLAALLSGATLAFRAVRPPFATSQPKGQLAGPPAPAATQPVASVATPSRETTAGLLLRHLEGERQYHVRGLEIAWQLLCRGAVAEALDNFQRGRARHLRQAHALNELMPLGTGGKLRQRVEQTVLSLLSDKAQMERLFQASPAVAPNTPRGAQAAQPRTPWRSRAQPVDVTRCRQCLWLLDYHAEQVAHYSLARGETERYVQADAQREAELLLEHERAHHMRLSRQLAETLARQA